MDKVLKFLSDKDIDFFSRLMKNNRSWFTARQPARRGVATHTPTARSGLSRRLEDLDRMTEGVGAVRASARRPQGDVVGTRVFKGENTAPSAGRSVGEVSR